MPVALPFSLVGRIPAPGDNVAIAIRRLESGTEIDFNGQIRTLEYTVLEGHRFAVVPIATGEPLLSWGLPFGHALAPIAIGGYVCNQSILAALAVRQLGIALPRAPNFADHLQPYQLDETTFRPAPPTPRVALPRTFKGYRRAGKRGVGTRNYIIILGTTSRTASFARELAARLEPLARGHPTIDGIVAVAHTEGGGPGEPNNTSELLRALGGFMVHPNVGAVLAVDMGDEPVSNARLRAFMQAGGYPFDEVPHAFLSIQKGLTASLATGEALVRSWIPTVAGELRTEQPLSGLRVALQCGGSDAFSGVSGNPLAGAIVHEVVRQGGTGVLCETDELSAAEAYIMRNICDIAAARALLHYIAAFKERLSWHGVTPESNPSAGNKLRGLYNIALKSLGAVHKKDPRTRVDFVTDYAEPLGEPGFYFMNSPGNDLESIAGQVGAGCNLFLFVTGNGSITNFPFVPTLKITTTTTRHQLLIHEMDINAGRYLDGESMETIAAESFDLTLATASGRKSKGELAGHSQASLWRNWRQTDASHVAEIRARPKPDGRPLPVKFAVRAPTVLGTEEVPNTKKSLERVGLVLPVSMCSAQIARLAADRMNAKKLGRAQGLDRFVALPHSEGCGFGGESMYETLYRTYRGYATHPNVALALLLEHGCEKVTNDAMRRQFEAARLPLERFGWASVQLDGGIEKTLTRVEAWFSERLVQLGPGSTRALELGDLTVGLLTAGSPDQRAADVFGALAESIISAGGTILIPEGDALLSSRRFLERMLGDTFPRSTLAYGEPATEAGFHIVATGSDHWVENLAGLGACGAHLFVGEVGHSPQQGHPLLPTLQIVASAAEPNLSTDDVDLVLEFNNAAADADRLSALVLATARREYIPAAAASRFVDFQLSRGLLGVTT